MAQKKVYCLTVIPHSKRRSADRRVLRFETKAERAEARKKLVAANNWTYPFEDHRL
jgi:hypothetical protein